MKLELTAGKSGPAEESCIFTCFGFLPAELRYMIWEQYMDALEDQHELFIHVPSDFVGTRNPTAPTVYTGFPAALHVNAEARAVVLKHVIFAHCPGAQCMVPVRPFNLDLDVFYIPWEAWRSFFLLREFHDGDAWLSKVQHFAFDICLASKGEGGGAC